jgi:MFS family permease
MTPHASEPAPEGLASGVQTMAARAVDQLDEIAGGPARRRVILLLAAVLALSSADAATIGAVAAELEPALGITHADVGLLVSTASLVAAVATVPVGVLTDRVCRTRLLAASIVLWAFAMLASGLATSFTTLLLARVFLGGVLATAGPPVTSLVGDYFAPRERGRVYGLILSGELAGIAIGLLVSGTVAGVLSWRASFFVLSVPALALAWAIERHLHEPARGGAGRLAAPPDDGDAAGDGDGGEPAEQSAAEWTVRERGVAPDPELILREDPRRMSTRAALRYVLRVPTNVQLIIASALGYFFLTGLQTFAVVYVRGEFGVSQVEATLLLVFAGLGALGGVLASGRLADHMLENGHVAARVIVPAVAFGVAAVVLVPALLATSLLVAMPLLIIGAAALGAPNPPLDAARLDIMPAGLWGRAESARTVLRTLAQAVAPVLFGLIADALGGGHSSDLLAPHAGPGNVTGVRYAFLLMLVPLAAGGVILLRAARTYARDVATAVAASPAAAGEPDGLSDRRR